MSKTLRDQTIRDFGEQWTRYRSNDGYYGSPELLADVFGPLLDVASLQGKSVAEIGAGTGRFIRIFLDAGASRVFAIEPSAAYDVLTAQVSDPRLTCVQARGDELQLSDELDYAFSVGVLHHIPDPQPVLRAMFRALRPGGHVAIWVYGAEGNRSYVAITSAVRAITTRLPHVMLAAVVWIVYWPVALWMHLSRVLPLPLAGYMRRVFAKLTPDKRRLVLYDQLNPAYAKHYSSKEVRELLERAGLTDIHLYHRHGYSWAAIGTKGAALGPVNNPGESAASR